MITRALAGFLLSGDTAKYDELLALLRKKGDTSELEAAAKQEARRLGWREPAKTLQWVEVVH